MPNDEPTLPPPPAPCRHCKRFAWEHSARDRYCLHLDASKGWNKDSHYSSENGWECATCGYTGEDWAGHSCDVPAPGDDFHVSRNVKDARANRIDDQSSNRMTEALPQQDAGKGCEAGLPACDGCGARTDAGTVIHFANCPVRIKPDYPDASVWRNLPKILRDIR